MRGREKGEEGKVAVEPSTTLLIHVQPRASRTEVVGWHGGAIKIRVAAPPVDGAANAELVRFLAEALGLPRSAIRVASGSAARHKRLEIDGRGPGAVWRSLGMSPKA